MKEREESGEVTRTLITPSPPWEFFLVFSTGTSLYCCIPLLGNRFVLSVLVSCSRRAVQPRTTRAASRARA